MSKTDTIRKNDKFEKPERAHRKRREPEKRGYDPKPVPIDRLDKRKKPKE